MKPAKRNLLLNLEQRIEQEAQEFKRRRLKEELDKLAAEESEAISPPEGKEIRSSQNETDNPDDDCR